MKFSLRAVADALSVDAAALPDAMITGWSVDSRTLEPGDLFYCGTCGGVGQGTNTFLKVGDVMETEIELLGKMRNKMVAEA